ncbi:uncharacterized protein K02A2.6-like [Sabethes cyaneus]|uniref:uncharacterized protein K02A2.6-like n=1 Tax=Sabethes cyaneus TaxID=53552 RepID=UPI00237EE5A4|nr:uncharacterized protein K02A2.6-like [Sabethes cyaneus]
MTGHLQKVCLRAKREKNTKSETHLLEQNTRPVAGGPNKSDIVTLEEVCKLEETCTPSTSKFYLDMLVNKVTIRFEVDTGAPVTIISTEDKKNLFRAEKHLPSDLELVSYCNSRIYVEGMLKITAEYREQSFMLPLYVSNVRKQPLLGRQWITAMQIDLNDVAFAGVHTVNSVATNAVPKITPTFVRSLVGKYANVYDESIGRIKGLQARLCLKPNARPVYVKARQVPFSLRDAVEKELDLLVENGVLEKVNHSAWATPVVAIMKSNNRVRLCGDYKVTVNPNLEIDDHPLPTIEELFASVAGGEKFTKIDLTQAYLQLEVEEGDREVLTLSTHRGLYRPTRLMYGIASAPAIWQRLMEEVLNGIPGVTVFLDDIRVTGPNDFIHLQRLAEVLKRLSTYNMRINIAKCQFFEKKIEYCGYLINKDGIHKVPKKIDAVQNMPVPRNKDQVRSFKGTPDTIVEETDYLEVNIIDTLPITVEELAKATASDSTVKILVQGLRNGKSVEPRDRFGVDQMEFTLQKGCIMRGIRVYIPPSLRNKVLAELHSTHFGITRLKVLARGYVWWEGIDRNIKDLVRNCSLCQSTHAEPSNQRIVGNLLQNRSNEYMLTLLDRL